MKRYLWACVLWPVVLLLVPNVYDDTVRSDERVIHDTTYADGRYVALVPGYEDTIWHDSEGWVRFIPDQDSIGPNVAYRAIRAPSGDSFLVISYDYLVADALDSATVDSIWDDWNYGDPSVYAVSVPNEPPAGADPVWEQTFAGFENTDSLRAWDNNEPGIILVNEFFPPYIEITLDTTDGYGNSDRSMKITWFEQTDSLEICIGRSAGVEIGRSVIDTTVGFAADEFYWEIALKFDTNWTTLPTPPDYCSPPNPDHKLFRMHYTDSAGALAVPMSFKEGEGGGAKWVLVAPKQADGSDNDLNSDSPQPSTYWYDGQWHLIRFGGRRSSAPGVADGTWWASIDSAGQRIPLVPIDHTWGDSVDVWWDSLAAPGTAPYFGRNRNIMPQDTMSYYWGLIRMYNADPGWAEFPGGADYPGE